MRASERASTEELRAGGTERRLLQSLRTAATDCCVYAPRRISYIPAAILAAAAAAAAGRPLFRN